MSRPIDADRLKEVLEKNFGHTGGASVLAQLIDAQPTVEPKRGKWIATTETRSGQIGWIVYKCSNCSHYRSKPMNYCEVCGAKMER